MKTGFAKPAKHRVVSSHRNFFFLKFGYKRTKLISEDVGNTNNNTGIKRESLLNRKKKSGLHQTVASVFYSSSNQINVSSVQPASILRKTAKTYNRGLFLSRDGSSPNLEVTTFLNNTKSGKSKISQGDPATVIETEPWRSPLCLYYSCAHYKETSCLLRVPRQFVLNAYATLTESEETPFQRSNPVPVPFKCTATGESACQS